MKKVSEDRILSLFDVKSLFTNVPLDKKLDFTLKHIYIYIYIYIYI